MTKSFRSYWSKTREKKQSTGYLIERGVLCVYCRKNRATTKDHVIPKSKNGKLTVPSCSECNSWKKSMSHFEFIKNNRFEISPNDIMTLGYHYSISKIGNKYRLELFEKLNLLL